MKFLIRIGTILLFLGRVPAEAPPAGAEPPTALTVPAKSSPKPPAALPESSGKRTFRRILLLNSLQFSDPWTNALLGGFKLPPPEDGKNIATDYLELNAACSNPAQSAALSRPFLDALRRGEYDLVVAVLDDAGQLLLDQAATLPENLPVILYTRRNLLPAFRRLHPNATGVVGGPQQLEKTVAAGLNLLPDTRAILVLTNAPAMNLSPFPNRESELGAVRITSLAVEEYDEAELRELVSRMPQESFIVFAVSRSFRTRSGVFLSPDALFRAVCMPDRRPVFVLDESLLDAGALGGAVATGGANGGRLADLAVRALRTGNAADIPPVRENYQLAFAMNAVRKHGFSESYIPPNALRLSKGPMRHGFWSNCCAVGFGIVALLLLATCCCCRRKYRRLRQLCEQLPLEIRFFSRRGEEKLCHGNLDTRLSEMERYALRHWQNQEHDNHPKQSGPVTRFFKFAPHAAMLFSDDLSGRNAAAAGRVEILILLPSDSRFGVILANAEFQAALQLWEAAVLPVAIRNTDETAGLFWCNPAFAELTGKPRAELIGQNEPDPRWHFQADHYPASAGRETPSEFMQFDILAERREVDGGRRVFRMAKIPLRLPNGPELLAEVYVEITAGYFRNARQGNLITQLNGHIKNLHLVNQCLRKITAENRLDRSINDLLRILTVNMGADRCAVFRYTPDYRRASNLYEFTAPGVVSERSIMQNVDIDRSHPGYYESLAQHTDIKVDDAAVPPEALAAAMTSVRERGIKSMLLCGIRFRDRLWGFMVLEYLKSKHKFTDGEVKLLHDTRDLFVLAQEKARQYQKLSDQALLYEQLFDHIDIAIVVFDVAKTVVWANRKSREILNHDLSGGKCYDQFCCYANTKFCGGAKCPLNAVIATRRIFRDIVRYEDQSYELLAQPILSDAGALLYIIVSLVGLEEILPEYEQPHPELSLAKSPAVKSDQIIRKILLVDDVELNLKVESNMLKSLGYTVVTAANGPEAVERFERESFDAVLTDLWMPEMSGEMLVRELRKRPGGMECRIYAITADTEAAAGFDLEYFDGVVNKPLTIAMLRRLLQG